MTWTVNAGRFGHLLHSPRAMPARLNLLFDLPMQEWWLDETNLGGSVAPAFGAAYLRALSGERLGGCEPYLMSRGNPYGTHSFPKLERLARTMLATTYGCQAPQSLGWPGLREHTREMFDAVRAREPWLLGARRMPWAAMLVSEQTRQFYAYGDIRERYLPHVFGAFRMGVEEHLPVSLVSDWELTPEGLAPYRVLLLPNAAALSDAQAEAVRAFVRAGGGVVATGDTSLADELGRPRPDFALSDLFGVSFRGRPAAPNTRPELDANFAVTVDEAYWRQRVGVATLSWGEHPLLQDARLAELVPSRSVLFRGPQVRVSSPADPAGVLVRLRPEGLDAKEPDLPGLVARQVGRGRVVYLAAGLDAALWSYAFPYQRRLLARAVEWAAGGPPPITVQAPMAVHATYFEQEGAGRRAIVHLFNGLDTGANKGIPGMDVPLREETVPISGIRVHFPAGRYRRFHVEPGNRAPKTRQEGSRTVVELPPLDLHAMLVAER